MAMNRYLLTALPTIIIFLSPSMRVAFQEWRRTLMSSTVIITMTIATQMNTQTTLLEYPLIPQQNVAKLYECTKKTQWNSQDWPHHKTRYMVMLYLPSFQVTMIDIMSLMKMMRIYTCPYNSAGGPSTLRLCYQ